MKFGKRREDLKEKEKKKQKSQNIWSRENITEDHWAFLK